MSKVSKIEIICEGDEASVNVSGDKDTLVVALAAIVADNSKENILRDMFTKAAQLVLMAEIESQKKKPNPKMANRKTSDKPFTKTRKKKNGEAV